MTRRTWIVILTGAADAVDPVPGAGHRDDGIRTAPADQRDCDRFRFGDGVAVALDGAAHQWAGGGHVGARYLSTLFGIVFLSHQVGAFVGVWLGGRVFDESGGYGPIWTAAVILGVAAALIHLPISVMPERSPRPAPAS